MVLEKIKKLNSSNSERVPHVGWNEVVFKNALLGFSENIMPIFILIFFCIYFKRRY